MPKIFWINETIKYKVLDRSQYPNKEVERSVGPGWYYTAEGDDEYYWCTPFEHLVADQPKFEINVGDKLLTRNGSIMQVGAWGTSDNKNKPQEAHFWFFKDTIVDRDGSRHEGTLAYYDKNLKHRPGNHIDKTSGYDIVGPYDDTDDKCPCCKRRYDGRKG